MVHAAALFYHAKTLKEKVGVHSFSTLTMESVNFNGDVGHDQSHTSFYRQFKLLLSHSCGFSFDDFITFFFIFVR